MPYSYSSNRIVHRDCVFIGRPKPLPNGAKEAHLRCTCGWRENSFAEQAVECAQGHLDRQHNGAGDIQPEN